METIVIRSASPADSDALDRLAALEGVRPLEGERLVAIIDGELVAAVEMDSGQAVADPFRRSAAAVEMLRLQARRERPLPAPRTLGERLHIRHRPVARAA
jgi:hypothetical protein